jgi:hypothetical protein
LYTSGVKQSGLLLDRAINSCLVDLINKIYQEQYKTNEKAIEIVEGSYEAFTKDGISQEGTYQIQINKTPSEIINCIGKIAEKDLGKEFIAELQKIHQDENNKYDIKELFKLSNKISESNEPLKNAEATQSSSLVNSLKDVFTAIANFFTKALDVIVDLFNQAEKNTKTTLNKEIQDLQTQQQQFVGSLNPNNIVDEMSSNISLDSSQSHLDLVNKNQGQGRTK